jgi:hypothetical protein
MMTQATPKIFVGTMFSNENEFSNSCTSLFSQTNVEIDHCIIHGKRELQAHQALYKKWNEVKKDYDAFIQLDPDTVLYNSNTLRDMYDRLTIYHSQSQNYTSIQCALDDFFINQPIYGLNMYLPDVIFNMPTDEVHCDRSTLNNRTFCEADAVGSHCSNPTFKQAFHFGLHRGLKNKLHQRYDCESVFKKLGDDRRCMAILGFDMSHKFRLNEKTSYVDEEFETAYIIACTKLSEFKMTL